MVKLFQFFAYSFFFLGALLFFIPKVSLYYYAEKELAKHKVLISKETSVDTGFTLKLNNASVYYDLIQSAHIDKADLKVFLFYNTFSLENIKLSDILTSIVPIEIKSIHIKHFIFNPLYITGTSSGQFGKATMSFNILNKNLKLLLEPSEIMQKKYRSTLRKLTKQEDGSYVYEKAL